MDYASPRTATGTLTTFAQRLNEFVFGRAIPLLFHWRSHVRLAATLALPANMELVRRHPKIRYKYLRRNYLYSSLSRRDAAEIMRTHYADMQTLTIPGFLVRVFDSEIALWSHSQDGRQFTIRLAFPRNLQQRHRMLDHEGDLALVFDMDGSPLYVLCMTIIPARLLQHGNAGRAMFIGRVQGVPDQMDQLRTATKFLLDITPSRLLVCAAESMSEKLGIDTMGGVSNDKQISRELHENLDTFFDYDRFWTQLGATRTAQGLYLVPSNIPEKPIEQIQQRHRSRAMKKRKFRESVKQVVGERFGRELCDG